MREKIISIETICKNFDLSELSSGNRSESVHSGQPIASALIDSIELDALAQIQNKCENIDRNVNFIMAKTKAQLSQGSSQSFTIDQDEIAHPPNTGTEAVTASNDESNVITASAMQSQRFLDETVHFSNDMLNRELNASATSTSSVSNDSIRIETIHDISGDHIDGNSASTDNVITNVNHSAGPDNSSVDAARLYELHLTKLPVDITENDVKQYIARKGVLNVDSITLHKLVKRNVELSSLSFVSFKIDTTESIAKRLCEKQFWSDNCVIKKFVHKNRNNIRPIASTVASAQNFRLPSGPSIQST